MNGYSIHVVRDQDLKECEKCGAAVKDTKVHTAWHEKIEGDN